MRHPCLFGEALDDFSDAGEVKPSCGSDGVLVRFGCLECLEQSPKERATLEVVALEPLVKDVEYREEPFLRRGAALVNLRLEPLSSPQLFPPVEKGNDEIVFGREVMVEGRLATPARAIIVSTPTARVPLALKSS